MNDDNLSAVLYGANDLRLEQRPIPEPKDEEVLLKMDVVGICGSDVHFLDHGHLGHFVVEKPMVLGHESSGTVWKTGKNVTNLKPGDRVAVEPGLGCRKCDFCREGRYNLCVSSAFCATPPTDGTLARYFVHPHDFCFKLPDHVSLEEGALLEPLSVAVYACRRGSVDFGSIVLVMGSGPIGLVTLLATKAFGASKVIVTDILKWRLDKAKEMGADYTYQVNPDESVEKIVQDIILILGCRPTISIDCVGEEMTTAVAVSAVKSGGTVVLVGLAGKATMEVPTSDILLREVDVRGILRYVNCYPTALEMVASGKVDVKPLITHHYKLEDTMGAFDMARSHDDGAIKVVIHANADWNQHL